VIAEEAGYGVRSVRDYIRKFLDLGLIQKWREPRDENYYRLILPMREWGAQADEKKEPGQRPHSRQSDRGNYRRKSDGQPYR
jgi:hypothetical protein